MRNLIPHCIQEYYKQGRYAGEFEALTMFVDVSGFTPMTQALMQQGHEGAEILATVMNEIFDLLINAVYERGGFVSTFAGDAFTAIFPFNNGIIPTNELILHVLACVKTFQALFHRHGIQTTPQGQFLLQFRVGLSGGTVEWGIVGETEKAYFFRGDAIDGCAASEHQAEKGEVMFDNAVAQRLRQISGTLEYARHIRSLQVDRREGGYYRLKTLPESLLETFPYPDLPEKPDLQPDILARFFPEALVHSTTRGEFRHVVSIFISFEGISTIEAMNAWTCVLLENINTFGGYFNRINFGDKGGFVLCGFGAPVTYENTIDRALQCMLAVKQDLTGFRNLSGLRFRAGITYGMAYAGIAGGEKRCEYTYYGEIVNLAARFMMKAEWGEVFVSDAVCNKTVQFNFAHKGHFVYKGIADPVSTWVLISRKTGIRRQPFTEAMIGRCEELQHLQQCADPIFNHTFAGVICIYGEAGIGKSRLAYALQETLMQQHTIQWFNCPADQIVPKPFNPFITCLIRYFEQSSEYTEEENRARFEEKYAALVKALNPHPQAFLRKAPLSQGERGEEPPHPGSPLPEGEGESSPRPLGEGSGVRAELIRTKSVIGAQLGLSWKGSLWEQLDAKGKYENTVAAIKNFFLAHSLLHPTVIELEDGHWFDSDSLVLIHALTRNVSQYPLLLLSTLRYSEYGSKPCLLNPQDLTERNIPFKEIELREFSDMDLRNFAEAHLEGKIDEGVYAVLAERTNRNPFFAEQLLHYFLEHELVEQKDGRWQLKAGGTHLPDTINAVLIARIDRLTDEVKEMVKTAAVVGRQFDVLLLSAMLKKDVKDLLPEVQLVEKSRIWQALQELLYMFRHALLRDIAYAMQLKARLRELHQLAAETIEQLYTDHLARWYADLAFHYEKAENLDKTIEYLQKAGDEAKAQYQNQQALQLYDRLLSHLQEMFGFTEVEIDTLLRKAEILELIGEWEECQQISEKARGLAEQIDDTSRMGQATLQLGIISRQTGTYEQATESFGQAMNLFETRHEQAGIARALRNMGMVYDYRGLYEMALACYEQAFKVSEELGDQLGMAKNANNMGILYANKGDYATAMTWYHKSVQICKALGEMLERSRVLNNIGWCHVEQNEYESAMAYYNQSLKICGELGDRFGMAKNALNMGIAYTLQGNYDKALTCCYKSLWIREELAYKRGIVGVLNHIGEIRRLQGDYEAAMRHYEQALAIAETLGEKLQIGIALGNIGHVYNAQEFHDKALASYDRAISIFQVLESKHFLSEYLLGKAEAVCSLQRYEEAQTVNAEGLRFAECVGNKEFIFQGRVLSAKIDFALRNGDAPRRLEEMLQQAEDDVELATLHYELWKIMLGAEHRQAALKLYQTLYVTTPNIEYKMRMEELQEQR